MFETYYFPLGWSAWNSFEWHDHYVAKRVIYLRQV